ncbi:MAG: pyridoxal phosphate-dependent aminotransferase [Myxococcota bacterium]
MRLAAAVAELAPSLIREMSGRKRATTVDLTLGQPGLRADPELLEAGLRALEAGPDGYTANAGLPELRERVAKHHGRSQAEEVVVTCGSEQAVYLALSSLIEPGDEVLVPDPGYPAYPGIVRVLGGVPVAYPLDLVSGGHPDLDVLQSLGSRRTRVVVWNAPSNPFGAVPDRIATQRLVDLAEKRGWVVLSDEIYRDLVYEGDFVSPAEISERAVVVSGLSKSMALTGFRIGYLTASAELCGPATRLNQLMVTCAPRLAQLMALEVFRAPERLRAHLPFYARAREALRGVASKLPEPERLHLGSGAFYAMLDVRPWAAEGSLALALELLEAEDVAVVPGAAFGPGGEGWWRLSYAAGGDAAAAGLERVARFLHARSREQLMPA